MRKSICISIDQEELKLIDEASKKVHRTRSNFLASAALEKATEIKGQ